MKLIDVLVMISKGELKEGTIIKITDKFFTHTYTYKEGCLVDEYNAPLEEELDIQLMLNCEVEIIDHSPDVGKMVKIEELDIDSTTWNDLYIEQKADVLFDKLNEVIRELNKTKCEHNFIPTYCDWTGSYIECKCTKCGEIKNCRRGE